MEILQVFFTCTLSGVCRTETGAARLDLLQGTLHGSGMTGFLVAGADEYIGLFEGEERIVLFQIESLLANGLFASIRVLREVYPKQTLCALWYVSKTAVANTSAETLYAPERLAEFIDSALKPFAKRQRH